MLRYKAWYESADAQNLVFFDAIKDFSPLFNDEWAPVSTPALTGVGVEISTFTKGITEKTLTLTVRGRMGDSFTTTMNYLSDVCQNDIRNATPGKFWLSRHDGSNAQYLQAFFEVARNIDTFAQFREYIVGDFKLVAPSPYWCQEYTSNLIPTESVSTLQGVKRYNGRYPYRYVAQPVTRLLNPYPAATMARITIFGPAVDPRILVGGVGFGFIGVTLAAGDRIVIDPVTRSMTKYDSVGTATNVYRYRDKTLDNFALIPPGASTVATAYTLTVDLLSLSLFPRF